MSFSSIDATPSCNRQRLGHVNNTHVELKMLVTRPGNHDTICADNLWEICRRDARESQYQDGRNIGACSEPIDDVQEPGDQF